MLDLNYHELIEPDKLYSRSDILSKPSQILAESGMHGLLKNSLLSSQQQDVM